MQWQRRGSHEIAASYISTSASTRARARTTIRHSGSCTASPGAVHWSLGHRQQVK